MLCHGTAVAKHKLQKLLQITSDSFQTDYFMYNIRHKHINKLYFSFYINKTKKLLGIHNSFKYLLIHNSIQFSYFNII